MWKSKNLFLNNELLSLLKCRKNEIENFITVRPPCYCVPFNWCGASRFYCDLIIRQIVVVSSSNGKKLKTESGDCKCAVEEMPTRKFSFEMKRSNNHRTASLANLMTHQAQILFGSTEIFLFSRCWRMQKTTFTDRVRSSSAGKGYNSYHVT